MVDRPERVRVRIARRGAAEVGLRIDATLSRAAASWRLRATRARQRRVALPVALELRLAAGLDRLDVALDDRQHARAITACGCTVARPSRARRFEVESAFEVAERPIAPAARFVRRAAPCGVPDRRGAAAQLRDAVGRAAGSRSRSRTAASRRSRPLPESDGRGALALTVLRAVGWLSRADLRSRPGPAGPGLPTPGAQVPGPASARVRRCGCIATATRAGSRRRTASRFRRSRSPGVEDGAPALLARWRAARRDRRSAGARLGDRAPRRWRRRVASREREWRRAVGARRLGCPVQSLRIVDLAGRDASTPRSSRTRPNAGVDRPSDPGRSPRCVPASDPRERGEAPAGAADAREVWRERQSFLHCRATMVVPCS